MVDGRWTIACHVGISCNIGNHELEKGGNPMAVDPVCHMEVKEKKVRAKSEYKGQTYYFCGKSCKDAFERNPEKYIQK
jgi:YHS domain-containing protein